MGNLLTGYECLALFTDEVQEKIKVAIANDPFSEEMDDAWEVAMEHEYTNVKEFLTVNFIWAETEEGYYYWEAIAENRH